MVILETCDLLSRKHTVLPMWARNLKPPGEHLVACLRCQIQKLLSVSMVAPNTADANNLNVWSARFCIKSLL